MVRPVASLDLVQTVPSSYVSTSRTGRHIAEAHRVLVLTLRTFELGKFDAQPPLLCLEDSARVVSHHRHDALIPSRTPQMTRTVDRVHSGAY